MDADVKLRWASGREQLAAALALREEVFVREQGVPRSEELDGHDDEALHLLAYDSSGAVVGTLRLLIAEDCCKVGRVAVARSSRGRGIASSMLALALAQARSRGAVRARLAAQLGALGVYERAGFAVESEPFIEAGIEHVWMGREL